MKGFVPVQREKVGSNDCKLVCGIFAQLIDRSRGVLWKANPGVSSLDLVLDRIQSGMYYSTEKVAKSANEGRTRSEKSSKNRINRSFRLTGYGKRSGRFRNCMVRQPCAVVLVARDGFITATPPVSCLQVQHLREDTGIPCPCAAPATGHDGTRNQSGTR